MFTFENSYVFLDDDVIPFEKASLSIASSAVLYGLSVYTVFPLVKTKEGIAAFRLEDHFKRLINSCRIIGIDTFEPAWDYARFQDAIHRLIAANTFDEDVFIRATVHVDDLLTGARSRGLHSSLSMFIYPAHPILPGEGSKLKTSVWRRVSDAAIPARAKVNGAYVNSVLAKQEALDNGYDDCIFLDRDGHVCELSAANIFLVKNNRLITPGGTSDLLEGINRQTILEYAKKQGMKVEERTVDVTELYVADEVFACGTSAYISPIITIDARTVGNGAIGKVTKDIAVFHDALMHGTHEWSKKYLTYLGTNT